MENLSKLWFLAFKDGPSYRVFAQYLLDRASYEGNDIGQVNLEKNKKRHMIKVDQDLIQTAKTMMVGRKPLEYEIYYKESPEDTHFKLWLGPIMTKSLHPPPHSLLSDPVIDDPIPWN